MAACGGSDGGPIPGTDGGGGGSDAAADTATASDAAPTTDASPDGSTLDDAGLPCPGASILHPGDGETRGVGTNVPFVGNARDANCKPITDGNLVWKDSLGGQIGTGGSFGYAFPTKGTRTVTLTANGTITASITLTIN